MLELTKYSNECEALKADVSKALLKTDIAFDVHDQDLSAPIKVVFVGQYSAGKSSILKMLTGRDDIAIGAGITTEKTQSFDWGEIRIVDTPGIHTEQRPDHDEITYSAIKSADMLVFVITNELFDSYLADHFRKLAIDSDKAGEMILVVNKMERTSGGNSPEQQEIIREDLRKVLTPYTPEDLHVSFLDAKSYLNSINEKEEDPEYAQELLESSGYEAFIQVLNAFVKEKRLPSKLTTGIYELEDLLDKGIKSLEPKSEDTDIDALEENFRQQRHALADARNRMQDEIKGIFYTYAGKIREIGAESADLFNDDGNREEIEAELEKAMRKAQGYCDECQVSAGRVLEERLTEAGEEVQSIEEAEFSQNLKARLEGKFDTLPDNVKEILKRTGYGAQKVGETVLKSAYNATSQGGLKLANFSGSNIHSIVLNAGHKLGYKFKPWQAIKITKGLAIAGQVFSVFGVAFSVGMQIKEDQAQDETRNAMRRNRQNIRSQFNACANGLEDYGTKYVQENVVEPLNVSIREIDDQISDIRRSKANRSSLCRELEGLQGRCRKLIQEIHSSEEII